MMINLKENNCFEGSENEITQMRTFNIKCFSHTFDRCGADCIKKNRIEVPHLREIGKNVDLIKTSLMFR